MIAGLNISPEEFRRRITKHLYTWEDVEFALGSPALARRCREAGWLKPVTARGTRLYAERDVAAAAARIINGDIPTAKKSENT
jgi:hypothetical protein